MLDRDQSIALAEAINMCDSGFDHYDGSYYAKIDERLATLPQIEQIAMARRMCVGNEKMSSIRFAYPHIKDRLLDALSILSKVPA